MSTLSQQVGRLRQEQQQQQAVAKDKVRPVSLLLSPLEAAEVDAASLLDEAKTGLEELQRLDPGLAPYQESLLHTSSLSVERELQTPEVRHAG